MAESRDHMIYVDCLYDFVCSLVPESTRVLIHVDKPDSVSKPPKISDGFVPDLFYMHENLLIIGEAKTANDIETKHILNQYSSYCRETELFGGDSVIVMSVPWHTVKTVKNIYRRLKKSSDLKVAIYVISEMGVEVV